MKSRALKALSLLFFSLTGGAASHATTLIYTATNLAGNEWRYDYAIANDTLGTPLNEFTLYFDLGLYQNLNSPAQPVGWNSILAQPDPALPDAGFFDSAFNDVTGGLAAGGMLSGFSVVFNWLGAGAPGSQSFDIIDPNTFGVLESGRTVQAQVPSTSLPEPGTASLLLSSLALIWLVVRWRGRKPAAVLAEGRT